MGGFIFEKSGRNWTFRFDRRRLFGGFFKPLTGAGGFHRSRYAWMVAGGPLASFALCLLCAWMFVRLCPIRQRRVGLDRLAVLGIVTHHHDRGYTISSGLNKSDMARLSQLIQQPERARLWMAAVALQTEEVKVLRPREWSAQLFDQILSVDAQARIWRDRACKLRKPESLHVVEAAIAMCEDRYEEAAKH